MAKKHKPTIVINQKALMQALAAHPEETMKRTESYASRLRAKLPDDVPVEVEHKNGYDGRPVGLVSIAHPSGLARQAKDGVMTRTGAEEGLEVNRYPERGQ